MADALKEAMERMKAFSAGKLEEVDWEDVESLLAALSAAEARERVKDEALKPFADAYEFWNGQDGGIHDDTEIDDQGMIKVAHLKAALNARALTPETPHAE